VDGGIEVGDNRMRVGSVITIKGKKAKVDNLWTTAQISTQDELLKFEKESEEFFLGQIKNNNYIQCSEIVKPYICGLANPGMMMRQHMLYAKYT